MVRFKNSLSEKMLGTLCLPPVSDFHHQLAKVFALQYDRNRRQSAYLMYHHKP